MKAGEKGGSGEKIPTKTSPSTPLSTRTKMEAVEKLDPDEEKARMDLLMRDDFIDDLTSGGFMPVQLPMVETGGSYIRIVIGHQNSRVSSASMLLKTNCELL